MNTPRTYAVIGNTILAKIAALYLSDYFNLAPCTIYIVPTPLDDITPPPSLYTVLQKHVSTLRPKTLRSTLQSLACCGHLLSTHYVNPERDIDFHLCFDQYGQEGPVAFHHLLTRLRLQGKAFDVDRFSLSAHIARQGVEQALPESIRFGLVLNSDRLITQLDSAIAKSAIRILPSAMEQISYDADTGEVTTILLENGEQCAVDLVLNTICPVVQFNQRRDRIYPDKRHAVCSEYIKTPCAANSSAITVTSSASHTDIEVRADGICQIQRQTYQSSAPMGGQAEYRADSLLLSPWQNNVIHLGHIAADLSLNGLSQIDILLLQMDALTQTFPNSKQFDSASTEYNRIVQEKMRRCMEWQSLAHLATLSTEAEGFTGATLELRNKLNVFLNRGVVPTYEHEILPRALWPALLMGLQIWPKHYDIMAETLALSEIESIVQACDLRIKAAKKAMLKP